MGSGNLGLRSGVWGLKIVVRLEGQRGFPLQGGVRFGRRLREELVLGFGGFENNYFTKMCGGSKAGSYVRLIDVVCHSTLGLRVIPRGRLLRPEAPERPGVGFGVWGLGSGVLGLGLGVLGLGSGVWGLGFRVWGLGFGV